MELVPEDSFGLDEDGSTSPEALADEFRDLQEEYTVAISNEESARTLGDTWPNTHEVADAHKELDASMKAVRDQLSVISDFADQLDVHADPDEILDVLVEEKVLSGDTSMADVLEDGRIADAVIERIRLSLGELGMLLDTGNEKLDEYRTLSPKAGLPKTNGDAA